MIGMKNVQWFVTEKAVSTRSAKQSQQMLLRRLKSDFHKALHFLAVQTVVSRQRQSYAQTQEKDSGPHWELSEELGWGLQYIWGAGGYTKQVPRLMLETGPSVAEGLSGQCALLSTKALLEGHGQIYHGHAGTPSSLCFLPPLACSLTSWSSREEAGNSINDTYQLIETMHRSLNSKYATQVLSHYRW